MGRLMEGPEVRQFRNSDYKVTDKTLSKHETEYEEQTILSAVLISVSGDGLHR